MRARLSLEIIVLLGLCGCATQLQQEVPVNQEVSTQTQVPALSLPQDIRNELMRLTPSEQIIPQKRFEINAVDVPIESFLTALVADTDYSIAIHPEVSGTISLSLKQVTLEQVFDVLVDLYGLDIQRSEAVYRVFPAGLRTETLTLNYLFLERFGLSRTNVNSGGVSENDNNNSSSNNSNTNRSSNSSSQNNNSNRNSNSGVGNINSGTSLTTYSETNLWEELRQTLASFIGQGEGRSLVLSPQAGLVTVRAYPNEIKAIRAFIGQAEEQLQRQVILEAKILEVTLDDGFQQGIQWSNILGNIGDTDFTFGTSANTTFPGNDISTSIAGITSISFVNQDFTSVVRLLETQGEVQTLSSPRITATNNQKALIKVGDDEYFVTEISATTTTGDNPVTLPDIELTPFFSGIALDVTPQINRREEVILHVRPSVTEIEEQQKSVSFNDQLLVLPLAQSTIRESDTVIKARSGEIVVIGGLMQTMSVDRISKTPLLGDIPFLGSLFTNKSVATQKKELVILIKPTVINEGGWREQLRRSEHLLKSLSSKSE